MCRGGQLIAVGDEDGTVGVYRTLDGDPIFQESREGERGRVRGMRGVALSPEGGSLASIAKDGLIRILESAARGAQSMERVFWFIRLF